MLSTSEISEFRTGLLDWFARHQRDLPWRRTRDPYAIWISEIMLQQTRVAAVIPYYERFLARFPNFQALAEANEAELLAQWAGLGYYHRARNLQKAARLMVNRGCFPSTYEEIRHLPGIGEYTAAAIASIAFDLPHAALDGNVFRVLSRALDDSTDIASSPGRQHFAAFAERLLDRCKSGMFNQAMIELGATLCLPADPQCLVCPVSGVCRARANGRQNGLPVKIAARKSVEEQRTVFWIEKDGRVLLWQRTADSRLMPGFWELPEKRQLHSVEAGRKIGSFRHAITFHNYRCDVIEARAPTEFNPCEWIPIEALSALPVSTIVRKARRLVEKRGGREPADSAIAGG